jgi:hypothetical protein
MEILRFEEAQTIAPKRKKSAKGYLTLGFVAALFSISSAFATNSITINNDANIALGQGISTFTTCDTKIGVTPTTALQDGLTTFALTGVTIGTTYLTDTAYKISADCVGSDFVVRFYLTGSATPIDICTSHGTIAVTGTSTNHKCSASGVYFRVVSDTHNITFTAPGLAAAGFFDHISIETTTTTY